MSLGDGDFKDLSANSIIIDGSLGIYGDISGDGYLHVYDASFRNDVTIANNLVVEHDVSINNYLSATDTSFHNDVIIGSNLVIERDVSTNHQLDAYDASFHNDVTISNDLIIKNDVSVNNYLSAMDASFHNNVTIAKDLVVENDVSINHQLDAYDASFRNNVTIAMDLVVENDVSINNYLSAMDASFHIDVTIAKDLVVENDVSINHLFNAYDASFHNNVTIANNLVIEHDVSINSKLSAYDVSFHNDVRIINLLVVENDVSINHRFDAYDASFHNDVTIANNLVIEHDVSVNTYLSVADSSFHNNVTIARYLVVENDVSINHHLDAYDVSFRNDVTIVNDLVIEHDVSINHILDTYDASFHNDVTVTNNLVIEHDVSINTYLSAMDTSFHNDVTIVNDMVVEHDISVNGRLDAFDVSFHNNLIVDNDISCGGAVKAPQVFAGTGPFTELDDLDSSYVFVGSNSNSDAVMRLEGTDGSGCEIVGSGSGDNRFGINIINDAATSKIDVLTISKEGNVGINNTSPTVKLDVSGSIAATDISGIGMVPIGGIIMWNSSSIPYGWVLCDGRDALNGVSIPDMRTLFVKGTNTFSVGDVTGGTAAATLTKNNMPLHNHPATLSTTDPKMAAHKGEFDLEAVANHGAQIGQQDLTTSNGGHRHNAPDYYYDQSDRVENKPNQTAEGYIDQKDVGSTHMHVHQGSTNWGWHTTYYTVNHPHYTGEGYANSNSGEGPGPNNSRNTDYIVTAMYHDYVKAVPGYEYQNTVTGADDPANDYINAGAAEKTQNSNPNSDHWRMRRTSAANTQHRHTFALLDPVSSDISYGAHSAWKASALEAAGWDSQHAHNHTVSDVSSAYNNGVDSTAISYANEPSYIILAYIIRVY